MSQTVSDFMLQRLSQWGVEKIFGFPGDGINGLMGAMDRNEDLMDFIQVRHEEMAAFMACGYAKFTGNVGVCMATSGPGAIHLLNGLYDAKLDHQPVVAIVGQQARAAIGGYYQQEVDLISLFKDVAHEYVHMATDPNQVRHLIDGAIKTAISERTVTCIIVPNDVQEMPAVEEPPKAHGTIHSGVGITMPRIIPPKKDVEEAAKILNEGERVAILIGAGAKNCEEEIIELADLLGAGVAKALLGKEVLADDLPFVTGPIGLLGSKPSYDMMDECDTLLMIGTSFPYSEFLPKEGQARGVQIDLDGKMINIRYPMEKSLVGDSKETLKELLPLIDRKTERSWRNKLESGIKDWWNILESRAMKDADPINPQRVFWELSKKLPDNCILTSDSGSSANWFARDLKIRPGMKASLSGNLATMCPGVPYAIAAKFAFPERDAIAMVGDGAMQMLGNNGLITISKYWKTWENPRLIILVLNNQDLNQVTWEQRVLAGNPKYETSQNIPDFPYDRYAELMGLKGLKMEKPEDIERVWEEALSSDRPVVINAYTDPNVPTIPPHITFAQAKGLTEALFRGDEDTIGMVKQTAKDAVSGVTSGKL